MHKFLLLLLWLPCSLSAQEILPSEGASLNYTQILFQTIPIDRAEEYTFIVTQENANLSQADYVQSDPTHVTVMQGFVFGESYTWKVRAKDKAGKQIFESDTHRFNIQKSLAVEPQEYHFAIQHWEKERVEDGVIFLDYCGVAINRAGRPLWYLPSVGKNLRLERLRDLEMTDAGTLTFVTNEMAVDIDLHGNILWNTPGDGKISGDSSEFYHHEFTRLKSGNYLVLCNGFEPRPLDLGDRHFDKIPLAYIVEYDQKGDTVWTWNSGMYVQYDDYAKLGAQVFDGASFGHMNSAAADEENGLIYASFRDLSSILVIDRTTRKVIRAYGDKVPSDPRPEARGFFQRQHAPLPFGKDEIVVFNNNAVGKTSSVVVFNEPTPEKPECKIQWEFKCDFDSLRPGSTDRLGNVQVMNENQFLVNMGKVPRLFEVNRQNEVLWDCFPERWNPDSAHWEPFANYRLHYRKSLYPCYYSHVMKFDQAGNPQLQLANEGSEADCYTLEFSTAGKKSREKQTLVLGLNAGQIQHIDIRALLNKRMLARPLNVRIMSEDNPALVRESTFRLK